MLVPDLGVVENDGRAETAGGVDPGASDRDGDKMRQEDGRADCSRCKSLEQS
jgi:hypothetical protein